MSFFTTDDSVDAIVADIGSYATKIGQAGEDHPRAYFRSNTAILREGQDEVNEGSPTSTTATSENTGPGRRRRTRRRPIAKVNYDALNCPAVYSHNSGDIDGKELDGNWNVANPVDPTTGLWYDPMTESNGHCLENKGGDGSDWADLIPTYLKHGYSSALGIDCLSANPLLLIERSYNPPPIRQQTLEILMEECDVPAVFFGRDAILSCYACGKTTSTVVDIGYSGTTITPVYEGYVESKGIRRCPIGTYHMDDMALQQLQQGVKQNAASAIANGEDGSKKDDGKNPLFERQQRGELIPWYQAYNPNLQQRREVFHRLSMLDVGRECRVSGAGQSINTLASKALQVPSMSFSLPDGETVDIPSQNRFAVAELVVGIANSAAATEETPSSTTLSSNDSTSSRRQQALESLQKDWKELLESAENDDMEEDDQMDVDSDEKDEKERQVQKYNEASAVGVPSRRTTRKRRRAAAAANAKEQTDKAKATGNAKEATQTKPKARFYNNILNRACAPYLKTLSEQLTAAPIANMVCDAAFRCDRDQQANVLGNVILSGGGACIGPTDHALPDLLREQMESIIHQHTPGWRVKVLSPHIPERHIASWLGGSILGSLGGFHEMWITKAEYEEWGSAIVNRKCP
ncbi:MAG: hypothetical protein SGBAC_010616 [Bacillariaceae sp.]